MSYILDALRKADAQRERDPSRGIHAHPTPLGTSAQSPMRSTWWWSAGAVCVALLGWGAWALMQDKPAPAAAAPVVADVSSLPVPARVSAPAPAPAAPSQPAAAPAIAPAPEVTPLLPAIEAAPATAPAPMRTPPQRRETALARAGGMPPQAAPTPVTAPVASPVTPVTRTNTAAAAPAPTPAATGLPPDAPRVAISGGVYSPDPAQRMLIVNGQVFNEGSEVAPGLAIDEIKARTAILKFRGARYTVAY
jgi:general secretion pathway protein B